MHRLNSHIHFQAALAKTQSQAWQRVCLSHHTYKTTDKPTDEKNTEQLTTVWKKSDFCHSMSHLWLDKQMCF